jgi:opacity protein-like surface antigen
LFGVALAVLLIVQPVAAQEAGRWAIGGEFGLNQPLFGLNDYTNSTGKWGVNFTYVVSPRVSIEFEYSNMKDDSANLEGSEFIWFIDEKRYSDPDVNHEISWHNLAFNSIVRLGDRPMLTAEQWNPYLTVGGGFYRYHNKVENLVWPGQAIAVTGASSLDPTGGPGPDNALGLPSSFLHDQRAALSLNAGVGLEAFVISNVSLDVRLRYHLSVGDLRPYNDFGLLQTFPLQQFDLNAGVKFYFMGG